jgi:hypothetical protein
MEKMLTIPGHKGNAYQNHTDSTSHLLELLPSRTLPQTNVGEDAGVWGWRGRKEPSTAGGNVS